MNVKDDPVSHPSHYTSDPISVGGARYSGEHGTQGASTHRNEVRAIDSEGSSLFGSGEQESEVEGSVRLRDGIRGLWAQPASEQDEELRVLQERTNRMERCREDSDERVHLSAHSRAPASQQAHGAGEGAHRRDGAEGGPVITAGRGSASPECGSGGQPTGEPRAVESEPAIRGAGFGPVVVGVGDRSAVRARAIAGHDPVSSPAHYRSDPSGVECITIARHRSFDVGNAIKYLWRAGLKDSSATVQDLRKAIFYIEDEIKRIEGQA